MPYADHVRLARTLHVEELFERFESDAQLSVAAAARRRVFVHAGVVGRKGRAVVIPGRSFTGETTLTAAPVRAGATYYSDEFAVLDAEGRVHPYAKPLAVRGREGRQTKVAAEELGGRAATPATRPLPVGLSRREMLRRVGLAAGLALPAVASIVAPTPADAASCVPSGGPCADSAQCCQGSDCVGDTCT